MLRRHSAAVTTLDLRKCCNAPWLPFAKDSFCGANDADLVWVEEALDDLGAELRQRMEAAGKREPGLLAVHTNSTRLEALHSGMPLVSASLCPGLPAARAGVEGGLPALRLLGQLLFGEGPPPSDSGFASIPPPDGYGLELKVVGGGLRGGGGASAHGPAPACRAYAE